jgi:regulatory protein
MNALYLPYEKALSMAQHYCAYQDRCTSQVLEWCRKKTIRSADIQRLLSDLARDGFLDDDRFARAYARGKFRNNQWGRMKIVSGLRFNKIGDALIEAAMSEIPDADYQVQLKSLLGRRMGSFSRDLSSQEQIRVASWAAAKGYERPLIIEMINQVLQEGKNECE